MSNSIKIIGSGFSGLATACYLAKDGYEVEVLEKNSTIGGRARVFEAESFTFDMGPSWYWMPDIFDDFFADFGKKTADYYELVQLSPAYSIFYTDDRIDLPNSKNELYKLFEKYEKGSSKKLEQFLVDAEYKYNVGVKELAIKPGNSALEFANLKVLKASLKLNLLNSFASFARKYFTNEKLLQLIEFPILFLGATPENTPALYSMMNHAGITQGTWYPMGGMYKIIEGMQKLATELGVKITTNAEITSCKYAENKILTLNNCSTTYKSDTVIVSGDYQYFEQKILAKSKRRYSKEYWNGRVLAPSCLIFYLGINKRIQNIHHHNLFFDADFKKHADEIYTNPDWPKKPLYYVCAPSITDNSVAPKGCENLFFLMPVAPDLKDTEQIREHYFKLLINRFEKLTGNSITSEEILHKKSYCINDFKSDYHAFKGNAYGLSNTLKQTAFLKPKIKSNKLENLFYTGQLTVPGPGVPPSLLSGKIVAKEVNKYINKL